MTIEEAEDMKVIAENKIVDILNELENDTKCGVSSITFNKVSEQGFGMEEVIVGRFVDITLCIK